jgi:hypothetical protein
MFRLLVSAKREMDLSKAKGGEGKTPRLAYNGKATHAHPLPGGPKVAQTTLILSGVIGRRKSTCWEETWDYAFATAWRS